MIRKFVASWLLLLSVVGTAWCQDKPAASPGDKPVITIVLPTIKELFNDLKLPFDLVGDKKGYETLEGTIQVFLVGVEDNKPSGVRIYTTSDGLGWVLSAPVANNQQFKEFLMNLWDLDVKTAPAPDPKFIRLVPRAIMNRLPGLRLKANERLIFNLFDGFLSHEANATHVHLGKQLEDVRLAKGGVPAALLKGHDLAVLLDGQAATPEQRREAFKKPKDEVLAALKQGENEDPADFAIRKAAVEHQFAEIERFFAESSEVHAGWTVSSEKKTARLEVDLTALPGTDLAASVELLDQTPDEFAGVAKTDAILAGSINFPIDPMRKTFLQTSLPLWRNRLKQKIEKQVDKDLADLVFDALDDVTGMGLCNGFVRSWPNNGSGTLTTVGAIKVSNGDKFINNLKAAKERNGDTVIQLEFAEEGDVKIHKLVMSQLAEEYPEVFAKDGTSYVGTTANALWIAAGEKALERMKQAIQEAKAGGPKPGPTGEFHLTLLPLIEILDKHRPAPEPKPASRPAEPQKKAAGDKKQSGEAKARIPETKQDTRSMLADLGLRKLAIEAFKAGKDTISMSMVRNDKTVELRVQFDEGIIRFIGKALSKFVKDNLGDE